MTESSPSRVQIDVYAHERGSVLVEWSSWSGCRMTVRGEPAWAEETLTALDQALSPHTRWWGRLGSLHRLLIPVTLIALAAGVAGLLPEGSFLAYAPMLLAVAVAAPPIVARDSWPLPFEFAEPGRVRAVRQAWLLVAWYALGSLSLLLWLAVLLRS